MPIGLPPALMNKVLLITEPPGGSFPANMADAADMWADVADALFQGVVPPSTTGAAARSAFIATLLPASPSNPIGVALLDAAFLAYAGVLAGGMAPLYIGTPPPSLPGLSGLLTAPSDNAQAVAAQIAGLLSPWGLTGIATLVAPPFTASPWV